jgi:hypothetical protein
VVAKEGISQCLKMNKEVTEDTLAGLCRIYGPIHLNTFLSILSHQKSDVQDYQTKMLKILKVLAHHEVL